MSMREKTTADFDLERFVDMFDEAMTSTDERVVNALRSLMMMVILTKPEGNKKSSVYDVGPLRQMFDDLHIMNRRMRDLEDSISQLNRSFKELTSDRHPPKAYEAAAYKNPTPWPKTTFKT